MISISKNKYLFVFLSIAALLAYGVFVQAAYPTTQYNPGETLDPDPGCTPGSTNCSVAVSFLTDQVEGYVYNNNSLHNNAFIFGDDNTSWVTGEEGKMFFDRENSSFRVGSVTGTEWEGVNMGSKSIAMGYAVLGVYPAPVASGALSIALGTNTVASGANSFAMGFGARATNSSAIALGNSASSGSNSFAVSGGTASGTRSFALGSTTTASGNAAVAFSGGIASGARSFAFGTNSTASADNSFAIAGGLASGSGSFAVGYDSEASNLGTIAIGSQIVASGDNAVGIGQLAFSLGFQGLAIGSNAYSDGVRSTAIGGGAVARGDGSITIGNHGYDGTTPLIIPTTGAIGYNAVSIGSFASSIGESSVAIGDRSAAYSYREIALGSFGTTYTPVSTTAVDGADRLFSVGNGVGSGLGEADALTILKNGKVGINIDNFQDTGNQIAPTTAMLQVSGDIATNTDVYAQNVALTSDSRLKKNIENLPLGLAQINQLRAVEYDMKRDDSHQFGFIAQEVQSIFPNLVMDGTYLSLNYIGIIPVLTKAVQELDIKISDIDTQATAILADQGFLAGLSNWLADATNGIVKIFANEIETKSLCVADDNGSATCITKAQLDQLLGGQNSGGNGGGSPTLAPDPSPESTEPDPTPVPDEEIVLPVPDPIPEVVPVPEPVLDPAPEPVSEPVL